MLAEEASGKGAREGGREGGKEGKREAGREGGRSDLVTLPPGSFLIL